jgi:hypothetical protein
VTYSFLENRKYTVVIRYTFTSKMRKDTQQVEEKVVIEADKKEIEPNLSIIQDSRIAPSDVKFDASASQVKT